MLKLDKETYQAMFDGYALVDCVVRSREIVYFILEQLYDEETESPPNGMFGTRIVGYFNDPPDPGWHVVEMTGIHRMKAGMAYLPKEQFVGVSLNDHVYVWGSGDADFETSLTGGRALTGQDIGMRGGISKLRTIDGSLWLAGSGRTVGKRSGETEWRFHDEIPYRSLMDDGGFRDIDGFNESDIYAVGGHGDLWHFDGTTWKQIRFPSDMTLGAVCCGSDGQVYIGADSGTVFKGRAKQWKMIHRGDMVLPFRDMVWYQDQIWCTSDYGIWTIKRDVLEEAEVSASVRVCAGNLSVGDGALLVAGHYGAALHDGASWHRLVDFNEVR